MGNVQLFLCYGASSSEILFAWFENFGRVCMQGTT